ncbi:MAG: CocE/NonD family hydrolase, partial [Candidatus Aminicenantes bacterium]|nr:CocE/NonD family hydrolase [Candidatus Aminicenantes bacterium]
MKKRIKISCRLILLFSAVLLLVRPSFTQPTSQKEKLEKALEASAVIEKKVMVTMRDGVRLATDIYRPAGIAEPIPTIFWRTPYNFNEPHAYLLQNIYEAVSRGYAFIIQNERGKFFSEGKWEILGRPRTDGYDALTWIADQPWSNGKVGTIGCSSSAEWQLALAAMDHPAHAAMIPMASGAGIGRVEPFYEQGNWYRGGVYQMLFASWLYGVQNTQRPTFSKDISQEDLVRLSKYFDLAPSMPPVDWGKAMAHLPLVDIIKNVDGPKGIYEELIQRFPNDPAWYEGGLYHDNEPFGVPSFWMNSWYDVSISPNLALFNHVTKNASDPEVAGNQFVLIAPTSHCAFFSASENTIVGERNMGDVRLDWNALIYGWFDYWLKGVPNGFTEKTPKVQYYTMGLNNWQSSKTWPPERAEMMTYYLDSGGKANSLFGDGKLTTIKPESKDNADTFTYDPKYPVPSLGGSICCIGGAVNPGSFDQSRLETRHDILVYTSVPLKEGVEVSGSIEITLFVSSDAKDTDFSVKLIDVYPDGRAYNLDETIQRARYREGYDRQVFMEKGRIYKLPISSMSTSNYFAPGHRIRIEVSSSNFPRFARNLNTGGNN